MKRKKTLLISIISAIILIIIAFCVLYFTTDIFKSNKKVFHKYFSKMSFNIFDDLNNISDYEKRMQEEEHNYEGRIAIKLGTKSSDNLAINEEINFTGRDNPADKAASAKIDFIQDGEKKLTTNYLKENDMYGVQFEEIVNQYIVFDNSKFSELVEKLGIKDIEKIPNRIGDLKYNQESMQEIIQELKQITRNYINLAEDQIPNKSYTKIKKEQIQVNNQSVVADGYKVKIKGEELVNIIKLFIKNAREDKQIYNLVNKISTNDSMDFEYYQGIIDELESSFIEFESSMKVDLSISVYKQGKNVVKLYAKLENSDNENGNTYIELSVDNSGIEINFITNNEAYSLHGEYNLVLKKDKSNGQEIGYVLQITEKQDEEELTNVKLTTSIYGNKDSQDIKTEIDLDAIYSDYKANLLFNNNTRFEAVDEIGVFKEGNHGVINEFTEEQINNLIVNLFKQIENKIDFDKTIIGLISSQSSLFKAAQNSADETKAIYVQQAISLVSTDILSEFRNGEIQEVTIDLIKNKLTDYLEGSVAQGAEIKIVEGTKKGEFIVSIAGVNLDKDKSTMDLTSIYNETQNSTNTSNDNSNNTNNTVE